MQPNLNRLKIIKLQQNGHLHESL